MKQQQHQLLILFLGSVLLGFVFLSGICDGEGGDEHDEKEKVGG